MLMLPSPAVLGQDREAVAVLCALPEECRTESLLSFVLIDKETDHEYAIDQSGSAALLVRLKHRRFSPELSILSGSNELLESHRSIAWHSRAGELTLFWRDIGQEPLSLTVSNKAGHQGEYALQLWSIDQESKWFAPMQEAWTLEMEAVHATQRAFDTSDEQERLVQLREALSYYERSARLWRDLSAPGEQARVLEAMAVIAYEAGIWQASADHAAASAWLYSQQREETGVASMWHLQGAALFEVEDAPERCAIRLLEEARQRHTELGNLFEQASVANELALVAYGERDFPRALGEFRAAENQFRAIGDTDGTVLALNNIGKSLENLEDLAGAMSAYTKALPLLEAVRESWLRPLIYEAMADTLLSAGDLDGALSNYARAAKLSGASGEPTDQARALNGVGTVLLQLGQLNDAYARFGEALDLHQVIGEQDALFQSLLLASRTARSIDLLSDAKDHAMQARALAKTELQILESSAEMVRTQLAVADINREQAALELESLLNRAAQVIGSTQQRLEITADLAELLMDGRPEQAHSLLSEAVAINSKVNNAGLAIRIRYGLAVLAHKRQTPDAAIRYVREAIAILEDERRRLGSRVNRARFSGSNWQAYQLHVQLLLDLAKESRGSAERQRFVDEALSVHDHSRARFMLETLIAHQSDADDTAEIRALRDRQQAVRQQLTALSMHANDLQDGDGRQILDLQDELRIIEADVLEAVTGEERELALNDLTADTLSNPFSQSTTDGGAEAPNTVVLEYSLGDTHIALWAVTEEGTYAFELPNAPDVRTNALSLYNALKNPAAPQIEYRNPQQRLYQALLPRSATPIGNEQGVSLGALIDDASHLVFVPDEILHYVPFSSLLNEDGRLLLETHRVSTLPSLSALTALRRARVNRPEPQRTLAVFAPDFSIDSRLPNTGASEPFVPELLQQLSVPLPEAQNEARLVAELAGPDALLVSGTRATKASLLGSRLADFRVLHFPTHGMADPRFPEISAIVMSPLDTQGRATDPYVQLDDIHKLTLNAELVVLSACSTSLGSYVRGEGFLGLAQAFLNAGAKQVIASRWAVSDEATAQLMTEFYRHFFNDGKTAAESLRLAQLSFALGNSARHPYYWAAFSLVGDWQP